MPDPEIPSEAPPSYSDATAASSSRPGPSNRNASSHLQVPHDSNNAIPEAHRRSMEDESRPLPKGWVRSYDPETQHQFFVDTTKDPPRSVWVHPYDDAEYLATLTSEERERIEQESLGRGRPPSKADIMAAHSDDDEDEHHTSPGSGSIPNELPPRDGGKGKGKDERSFGRKWKDKLTGTTHEEREQERKKRAEEERRMYAQHLKYRQAMARAVETGQPQLLGKDHEGKDVYIEPPAYQGGYGGYGGGGYGYSPYGRTGVYSTPNARYIRPAAPYSRPVGYGYGGGYGLPLALGGGLLGGVLLGDAIGGFGGGFGGGGF